MITVAIPPHHLKWDTKADRLEQLINSIWWRTYHAMMQRTEWTTNHILCVGEIPRAWIHMKMNVPKLSCSQNWIAVKGLNNWLFCSIQENTLDRYRHLSSSASSFSCVLTLMFRSFVDQCISITMLFVCFDRYRMEEKEQESKWNGWPISVDFYLILTLSSRSFETCINESFVSMRDSFSSTFDVKAITRKCMRTTEWKFCLRWHRSWTAKTENMLNAEEWKEWVLWSF